MSLRKMGIKFVVGLPTDHGIVASIMFGQSTGDAPAMLSEQGVGKVRVLPRSMAQGLPALITAQQVRMAVRQPARRGRRGSAEDGVDAVRAEDGNGFIEQGKVIPPLLGLQQAP